MKAKKNLTIIVSWAAVALACSDKEKGVTVNYERIGGSSAVLGKVRSACELASGAEQAGRYKVASLTGVYEEFPVDSGEWEPHTYVELELVEAWTSSAGDLTVRIAGGPFPDGSTASHFIELEKGETVGAIINTPYDWNANYHFLEIQQVFKEEGGKLTNGYLRDTSDRFSTVVGAAVDQGECVADIVYERDAKEPPENNVAENEDPNVYAGDMGTPDAGM